MTPAAVAAAPGHGLDSLPDVDVPALPEPPDGLDEWLAEAELPVWPDGWWPEGWHLRHDGEAPSAAPGGLGLWQYDDRRLLTEVDSAAEALARAHAHWLALLAEAECRESSTHETGMPTASWLAAGSRHSARAARSEVRLATLLQRRPAVSAALAAGSVSLEQASVLAHGLDRLPHELDADQVAQVEGHLVALAGEFGPTALRTLVKHAVEVVAPDVAEAVALESLERAEKAQQRERHLSWRRDHDGGWLLSGKLTALDGELLTQHLDALASAERLADAASGLDTSRSQARADALALAVCHHATCTGGPVRGGDATRVLVTLRYDDLLTGLGRATLVETGEPLSASRARHLACAAGLLPVVLDGRSLPLELGRLERLFSTAQRAALALRDGGCAFPGCDRPPSDCEAHHRTPWAQGGRTDIGDGVLLCPHHHRLVEPDPRRPDHANWQVTMDARGRPRFTPPAEPTAPGSPDSTSDSGPDRPSPNPAGGTRRRG